MAGKALDQRDREEIRAGIENGYTNIKIAELVGFERRTIGKEIARNGGRSLYRACEAQQRADLQRRRPRLSKLAQNPKLCRYIEQRLQLGDSPMTISIELARGVNNMTGQISHQTIYDSLYASNGPFTVKPNNCLRLRRHKPQPRGIVRATSDRLADSRPIKDRPARGVVDRSQVGHLEGDLVVGAMNRSAIVTLVDRASRRLWMAHVDSKSATNVCRVVVSLLETMPDEFRVTLTWDRGAEIGYWRDIEEQTGITVFVADPRSPWQRGSNEQANSMIRRYLRRGTNLKLVSPHRLAQIETRINTIPRRSLQWATAHDIYTQHVTPTT